MIGERKEKSKFLIFTLANERYGISLSAVKEVIAITEITPIPQMPGFFKGLINLRGRIISVMDLRIKLGVPCKDFVPKNTCIIISEFGDLVLGSIVDEVNEVMGLENKQIESNLDIQSSISREFITGAAKANDKKLILLLDIAKVLSTEELKLIKKKTEQTSQSFV